jgi:hypothetical protein
MEKDQTAGPDTTAVVLPERFSELRALLWDEVAASKRAIGPGAEPQQPLEGWEPHGHEQHIQQSMRRARTLLGRIAVHPEWEHHFHLDYALDFNVPANRISTVAAATRRMLQLVALSRVPVHEESSGITWPNPLILPEDLIIVQHDMRVDLGVADTYQSLRRNPHVPTRDVPHFPGIGDLELQRAILDGTLQLGNPQQPGAE